MAEKKEIFKELEERFEHAKKELGFKSSLDDLDEVFYIREAVLKNGFVSERVSRQICSRIVESYNLIINYLHGLVLPSPQNMIAITESKMFDEQERKDILKLMTKTMAILSLNNRVGQTKDKKLEAEFIDSSLKFWKEEFNPKLKEIVIKVSEDWKKRAKEERKD